MKAVVEPTLKENLHTVLIITSIIAALPAIQQLAVLPFSLSLYTLTPNQEFLDYLSTQSSFLSLEPL
jgi:hypothetical protein